ncbi:hypothetical protein QFZ84_005127 [Pseudomonas fluorescens]
MDKQNSYYEKLNRITSDPDNFGWAPLAWAHTED